MKLRTTFILMLTVACIGSFIWFFERHKSDTQTRQQVSRLVLKLDSDRVSQVDIQTTNFNVTCVLADGVWRVTEPVEARADRGEIRRILEFLEEWERSETITKGQIKRENLDIKEYGVLTPRLILVVGNGEATQEIRVGRNAPTGDGLYLQKTGDDSLIAASTNLWTVIPQSVSALRSRRLLEGLPSKLDRVEIKRSEGVLGLLRSEERGWVLSQPFESPANVAFVNDLVFGLFDARVEEFVFDDAAELSPYGLDAPRARISLWLEDSDDPQVLLLGDNVEEDPDQIYAMLEGENAVVSISASLYDSAVVSANALRDRQLLDIDEPSVSMVQIDAGEESLTLEKDDAGSWFIANPVRRKAQDALVWDLIAMWARVGIVDFIDDDATNLATYGLAPPTFEISFFTGPPAPANDEATNVVQEVQEPLRVSLGLPQPDKERLLVRLGDRSSVYAVPIRMLQRLSVTPLFYYHREVLALASEDVRRIQLESGSLTQAVERNQEGEFTIVSENPTNRTILLSHQVETVLQEVRSLRVLGYVTGDSDELDKFGLAEPGATLTLGLTGEAGISKSLLLGAPVEEEGSYAMIRGRDVVFVLSAETRDKLFAPLYAGPEPELPVESEDAPEESGPVDASAAEEQESVEVPVEEEMSVSPDS